MHLKLFVNAEKRSLFSNVKHERLPALKWHCALKDEAIRLAVRTFNPVYIILLRDADVMLIPNVTDRNLSGDHRQLEEQASSAGAVSSASKKNVEPPIPALKLMRNKISSKEAHFVPSRIDSQGLPKEKSKYLAQAFNTCFGTGSFSASRYLLHAGISPQFAAFQGHDHHLFQALKRVGCEKNLLGPTKSTEFFFAVPNPPSLKPEQARKEVTRPFSGQIEQRDLEMTKLGQECRFAPRAPDHDSVRLIDWPASNFRNWAVNQASHNDVSSISFVWLEEICCRNFKNLKEGKQKLRLYCQKRPCLAYH